ncbi:capsid protein [Chicken smacovirus mg7_57]|nr:capsid protein [Chicken smacovirus mg7_57]
MVMVKVSETYDLSTKVNKLGLVGIHTPTGSLLARLWGGLALHYKKFRFVKCDVAMACASMLPADPLQVGVEAGDIAPQDLFNPILYRAVSNDSMNNLLAYIQSYRGGTADAAVDKNSVIDINDTNFTQEVGTEQLPVDQFGMYYSLLADSDSWKKAMPQSGLVMRGLYPLVYSVVSQYGANNAVANALTQVGQKFVLDDPSHVIPAPDADYKFEQGIVNNMFRGPAMRMPAIDTTFFGGSINKLDGVAFSVPAELPADPSVVVGFNALAVPPAYVALIVLPPAKLNQLYYRLKVTWTIEFTGLRSLNDLGDWRFLENTGLTSYGTDYASQSQSMSAKTSMVDADGASVNKIMEGS